jgi:molybdate-binding protein
VTPTAQTVALLIVSAVSGYAWIGPGLPSLLSKLWLSREPKTAEEVDLLIKAKLAEVDKLYELAQRLQSEHASQLIKLQDTLSIFKPEGHE